MADAMILPCGHTFGAGGIEQVKQMVQSFVSSITSSLFFALFYLTMKSVFCHVLLESLLHMFAASLRRLDNAKSQ